MKQIIIPLLSLVLLSACAIQRAEVPVSFLGDPIPEFAAEKTIEILPETKWVNVTGGENIKFVIGDKSFSWYLMSPLAYSRSTCNGLLHQTCWIAQ